MEWNQGNENGRDGQNDRQQSQAKNPVKFLHARVDHMVSPGIWWVSSSFSSLSGLRVERAAAATTLRQGDNTRPRLGLRNPNEAGSELSQYKDRRQA